MTLSTNVQVFFEVAKEYRKSKLSILVEPWHGFAFHDLEVPDLSSDSVSHIFS